MIPARLGRALLSLSLVSALVGIMLVGMAGVSLAGDCDWEWGGVPESPPVACTSLVPVAVPTPVPVEEVSPIAIANPLPVDEVSPVTDVTLSNSAAELDDAGYFANAVYLGLGLLVFLLGIRVVHAFQSSRA